MRNLFTRLKAKKNKGFTLVELIIVVAVIAVLASVLAPQYLRYVERTRESNDLQVATNIMRAATVAIADPNNDVAASADIVVTWVTGGSTNLTVTGGTTEANAAIREDIATVMGWWNGTTVADVTDAESALGTGTDFTFEVDASTGNISDIPADWGTIGVD